MDITGEYTIDAKRQDVWDALNSAAILKKCIPGCTELEKLSDTEFKAKVTAKIGVVRAKLKGEVTLSDIDAPNSYTISGAGSGGVTGFAKGGAKVSLADAPNGGTVLSYDVQVDLGGKLAAVGSRVIQGVAKKMTNDFFGEFVRAVTGDTEQPAPRTVIASEPVKVEDVAPIVDSPSAGLPDWMKSAFVNAAISTVAVVVAVWLTSH